MNDWVYPLISVDHVHDGDTFTGTCDRGDGEHVRETFRLLGINAPELGQPGADAAKQHLEQRLTTAKAVEVQWHERGDFGRPLTTVYCDGVNVNQEMLDLGLAEVYKRG